jgi:UDP-N-acetylmuramoylalanine--D-glutamate ligase
MSFDQPIILLAGGREKHLPLRAWAQAVHERCVVVVLFGESAAALEQALLTEAERLGSEKTRTQVFRCPTLSEAVPLAQTLAKPEHVVLLSPACLSFDAYRNFEERGQAFKAVVRQLHSTRHRGKP